MPEFDNIVPKNIGEMEPFGYIAVQRKKFVESGSQGTYHIENGELMAFADLKDAFEYSTKDPESMHEFIFPLAGASLAGSLNYDPDLNAEVVMLTTGQRMGISPKTKEDEYFVYTDNRTFFHIIFTPDVKQRHLFRKDSVFLSLDPVSTIPILHFTFVTGNHSFEDFAVGMTELLKTITGISNKLLDGYCNNP